MMYPDPASSTADTSSHDSLLSPSLIFLIVICCFDSLYASFSFSFTIIPEVRFILPPFPIYLLTFPSVVCSFPYLLDIQVDGLKS